ncbi:MAG: flagellar basal body L-ring protein FlgH [Myxococcota bacterium]
MRHLTPIVALSLTLWASPALAKKDKTEPPPPEKPEVAEAAPERPVEPGSLWNEVQARRLMGLDAGARQVGDLVTVLILEETSTSLDATTDASKSSSATASIDALLGAEQTLTGAHPKMGGQIAIGGGSSTSFTGTGGTTRGSAIETMLTTEVIEVLQNGNLRLWGYKKVRVNRETQYVVITGVVRPRDIQMDNTVVSDRLSEAEFEITGSGVVADKQGPGFLSRVLDFLWPF